MTMLRLVRGAVSVGILCFAAVTQVAAQERTLRSCQQINDKAQRLACFDALASGSKNDTAERQAKQFGLDEQQKAPEDRKEAEKITAAVVSASGTQVQLDNDMIWRVVDNVDLLGWVRSGHIATVTRGLLSGYRMRVDGVRGIMVVTRVR